MANNIGSTGPRPSHPEGGQSRSPLPAIDQSAGLPTNQPGHNTLARLGRPGVAASVSAVRRVASLPLVPRDNVRYRRALDELRSGTPGPMWARGFIERYLQPDSWRRGNDRRAELLNRFAARIPDVAKISDADELEALADAILDVVRAIPGDQQCEPLVALVKAAADTPNAALMLRNMVLEYASIAYREGALGNEDYARFLVAYACSVGPGELFDRRLLDGAEGEDAPAYPTGDAWIDEARVRASSLAPGVKSELQTVMLDMADVAPLLPGERQRTWLTALSQATFYLSYWANGVRTDVLKSAFAARQRETIDDEGYAEIIATLARSSASADVYDVEALLGQLVKEIERLPEELQGALYGSLFGPEFARQPESSLRRRFGLAWEGLKGLSAEHAKPGLTMLRRPDSYRRETREWIVDTLIGRIRDVRRDLLAPTMPHVARIIVSLPSASAADRLQWTLSAIDAASGVSVDDLLPAARWRPAEAVQIFEHMLPIATARADDSARANDLASLAVLARRIYDEAFTRFTQIADALDRVPMSFRFEPLTEMQKLADALPPRSTEREAAFERLRALGVENLLSHKTPEAWQTAFPPRAPM